MAAQSQNNSSGPSGSGSNDDGAFKSPALKARRSRSRTRTPGHEHGHGSGSKAPGGRNMFSSLERGLDRMIKAITPRKKPGAISQPRKVKTFANVSTTSTKSPERVLHELIRIMRSKQDIDFKVDGWFLRGRSRNQRGQVRMNFELEIVNVSQINLIGVRRKRLAGDAFLYKRICEDILKLAQL